MNCLASQSKSKAQKLKLDLSNNALEFVLTIVAYVLFDKFGLSYRRVMTLLRRIEYYANIILDNDDDMTYQSYKDILKDEYGFEVNLKRR